MPQEIHVHLLPALVREDAFRGATAVVIDVLRASSTIISALAAGAAEVAPCLEIDSAVRVAEEIRGVRTALLGGERGGLKIAGFDLGNSPFEYTAEAVAGRAVVFTTTNG